MIRPFVRSSRGQHVCAYDTKANAKKRYFRWFPRALRRDNSFAFTLRPIDRWRFHPGDFG
jgi:hypothetical protein